MNIESKGVPKENNLLTNFDGTVESIRQIEGESWYRGSIKDVEYQAEKVRRIPEPDRDPETVIGSFYGDGGVTRWMVMASGEVKFSAFHDTGDKEKSKTKRAKDLGLRSM